MQQTLTDLETKKNDLLQIKNAGTNTFAKMLYATMSYAGIYDTRSNFFEDRVQDRGQNHAITKIPSSK